MTLIKYLKNFILKERNDINIIFYLKKIFILLKMLLFFCEFIN